MSNMGLTEQRVEWHLIGWADWMQRGGERLGYPGKSAGFVGGGNSTSFEDMCFEADNVAAKAVDALLDGLPTQERLALHNAYLSAVYRIRDPLGAALERAKASVGLGLHLRGFC